MRASFLFFVAIPIWLGTPGHACFAQESTAPLKTNPDAQRVAAMNQGGDAKPDRNRARARNGEVLAPSQHGVFGHRCPPITAAFSRTGVMMQIASQFAFLARAAAAALSDNRGTRRSAGRAAAAG